MNIIYVSKEWIETPEQGWICCYGWESEYDIFISEDIVVTDWDKYGHPIKGYYVVDNKN